MPPPILQVAGGALLSLAPGVVPVRLEPEVFLALFIPPLLFADGWLIPKRDVLRVMRPVLLLALGLVALAAERETLLRLHGKRAINEETLRVIQREIDHLESALAPASSGA